MTVDHKLWRFVFDRDRGICRYCGVDLLASFSAYWSATVDHVQARSANGPDDQDNLVCSCPACNSMLSRSKELVTFETRKAYVDKRRAAEMAGYEVWRAEMRGAE
ncbi:MAG: HNH endonuclease [Candidatus Delongbacteria bacterium]